MRVTYALQFFGKCPIDDETIPYDMFIASEKTILVEAILEAVKERSNLIQEELTKSMAVRFYPCRVFTVGTHKGVLITCSDGALSLDSFSQSQPRTG